MIERVIEQRRRDLGGFEVGRVLPSAGRRMVGPFVFFDHMGPVDFPKGIPRTVDVRPHPHIGLSTVTYLFEGEIMHRDSVGSEQPIRPGEVNWMTAGRGITHSERFERARREGGRMHGIQAWVALPRADEETEPAFAHYGADALPTLEHEGLRGSADRRRRPSACARRCVRTRRCSTCTGSSSAAAGRRCRPNTPSARSTSRPARSRSTIACTGWAGCSCSRPAAGGDHRRQKATCSPLGGEPLGQRFIEWNFVSSSRERIEQAKADWRAGRMKLPDLDDREWIPLPSDPPPPAEPMS